MDMSPVQSLLLTEGSPIIKGAPPPWANGLIGAFFLGALFQHSEKWGLDWMDGWMVIIGQC